MFYRRKLILALLEAFDGKLGKLDLQKLLFLLTRHQDKASFDFIPYHYGCFSYQSLWDLNSLVKSGLLEEVDNRWVLKSSKSILGDLEAKDKSAVLIVSRSFKGLDTNDLIRHTYIKYPYYATRSKIAKDLLSEELLAKVYAQVPQKEGEAFFTIGYEGLSIEKYFNRLILNDVKALCDVRRNPISQKVGFSRPTLQKICSSLGIAYIHIPELGIEGEKRQGLKTQSDYDTLFKDYERDQLANANGALMKLSKLVSEFGRIAITCFEASPSQCHRGRVAKALSEQQLINVPVKHL